MPARARLPATTDTGLARPPVRRRTVHPDRPGGPRDTAVLPVQRLEEPCLQLLKIHDPRNSLKIRVLRGSLEPARPEGASGRTRRIRTPDHLIRSKIEIVQGRPPWPSDLASHPPDAHARPRSPGSAVSTAVSTLQISHSHVA